MQRKYRNTIVILLAAAVQAAGCAPGDSSAETRPAGAPPVAATQTSDASLPSDAVASLRFVVAPTGNEVRYRIREQLARVALPNDAVGKTSEVTW